MTLSSLIARVEGQQMLIKAWRVVVDGFSGTVYYSASRGKALRDSWHSYRNYRDVPFKEFLRIARCWREIPAGEHFGKPITVSGKPAFFVTSNNQYVQFCRPGGDEYFNAHPYEVEPENVRPWTYRDRISTGGE